MRGVSPAEIEAAVAELNSTYDADEAPYWIEQINGGYRLVLRESSSGCATSFTDE